MTVTDQNRTVLMILYYFPPCASGGTYRPLKFIRYLDEYKWQCVIIAPTECRYESQDSSLLQEIPYYTEIVRVHPGVEATTLYHLARKTGRGARYERKFIPDKHIGFAHNAIKAAKRIIEQQKIDVIFTSAPPYSIHVAGRELTKETEIPWIADFRDPWVSCPFYKPTNRELNIKYREIEESYFRRASAVISFPESRAEIERKRYPEYASRIVAIDNGFDPADFPDSMPDLPSDEFSINHIGAITKDRPVTLFLEALKKVFESNKEMKSKAKIHFYGDARPPAPQDISRLNLKKQTVFHGYVSHSEACDAMTRSHLLFMVLPDIPGAEGIMPLRLFEYIYSKRPIFLIAPQGEASNFLEKANAGIWVNSRNPDDIAVKLNDFINNIESGNYNHNPNLDILKTHERKALTKKLASLFDRIIAGWSARG